MSVPVWELKRGDQFTIEGGRGHVFTFQRMDGMYCYALAEDGEIFNWSGPVDRVEVTP